MKKESSARASAPSGPEALREGDPAPDFTLPQTDGSEITLSNLRGQAVVLFFYPKDLTPGCTTEACDFRDARATREATGVVVLGISPDPVKKHVQFAAKHDLDFPLLADTDHRVQLAYGVRKEKSLYGKTFLGVERSTFLIDGKGIVRRVWRQVKVAGHVDEVLRAAAELA
ncbi:MAG: thioredoxin-dependent thiol peroxidase [Gemmatimonadetes bacterium]|nr:thioredoxin-dependent thiol peroxidase [Gemmatimonadota bacterium]